MKDNDCANCPQSERCGDVYRRLGHSDCEPVLGKVVVAFLIPILSFIVSYSVLSSFMENDGFSAVAAVLSVIISATLTGAARFFFFRRKNRNC
ncbi:MAG: hypothetical protein AB7F23_07980 [Phycisphaerae bacterium]